MTAETFSDYATESGVRPILARELGPSGPAMAVITRGLGENEAARRRTRIRSLLSAVAGITS